MRKRPDNLADKLLREAVRRGKPIDWDTVAPPRPQYNPPRPRKG